MPNFDRRNKQLAQAGGGEAPQQLYRADILRAAKNQRYRLGFREIAGDTRLSVNSVKDAIDGKAIRIDTLYILADYFGIEYPILFDLDRRFDVAEIVVDPSGMFYRKHGFEIVGLAAKTPATDAESGVAAGKKAKGAK